MQILQLAQTTNTNGKLLCPPQVAAPVLCFQPRGLAHHVDGVDLGQARQ
jgi:hypothetical protein